MKINKTVITAAALGIIAISILLNVTLLILNIKMIRDISNIRWDVNYMERNIVLIFKKI